MWRFENARGESLLVPAVVRNVTAARVTILGLFGDEKELRQVKADRLTARSQHFKELDEN